MPVTRARSAESKMSVGYAVLFPGQGSQRVGMGADLFRSRPDLLIEAADRVLGWSLREVCLEGPEDRLTATEHAQPALYALSYALWKELAERAGRLPAAAAGHSLGEYTALAAAGAVSFEDGLELVAARARAMAEAVQEEPSGMAAVLGATAEHVERIAADRRSLGGRLWISNRNAPGQIVLSGGSEDIDWVVASGRRLRLRRVVKLNVAGAFHCPLMESALPGLQDALDMVQIGSPAFPVWSNVTASTHVAGEESLMLARQLVAPVRFSASLRSMAAAGVETFVHIGPGDVTAGMARRTVKGSRTLVVSSVAQAKKTAGEVAV